MATHIWNDIARARPILAIYICDKELTNDSVNSLRNIEGDSDNHGISIGVQRWKNRQSTDVDKRQFCSNAALTDSDTDSIGNKGKLNDGPIRTHTKSIWMGVGCPGNTITNTKSKGKGIHIHIDTIRDKNVQPGNKRILSIHNTDNILDVDKQHDMGGRDGSNVIGIGFIQHRNTNDRNDDTLGGKLPSDATGILVVDTNTCNNIDLLVRSLVPTLNKSK
ncbi:hypothetical protein X927_05380 [Petrotoga mexicana DSM 14811]|uniref:Uncharacterized protein n=1 Tax=Petrotoga mexicana DSM 14811 TaxID=1122954 RepID=A0A2K1P9T0_9BACT|nr:hypothetical protein X927_05380 [Petrotoga mexicana DSM 14811]